MALFFGIFDKVIEEIIPGYNTLDDESQDEALENLTEQQDYDLYMGCVKLCGKLRAPAYFNVLEGSWGWEDQEGANNLLELDRRHITNYHERCKDDPSGMILDPIKDINITGDTVAWVEEDCKFTAEMISLKSLLENIQFDIDIEKVLEYYPYDIHMEFKPVEGSEDTSTLVHYRESEFPIWKIELLESKIRESAQDFLTEFRAKNEACEIISLETAEADGYNFYIVLNSVDDMRRISIDNFGEDLKKVAIQDGFKEYINTFRDSYEKHLYKLYKEVENEKSKK